jgi:hypothetical protein
MPGRPPGVKGKKSPRRHSSAGGGPRCTARLAVNEKAPGAAPRRGPCPDVGDDAQFPYPFPSARGLPAVHEKAPGVRLHRGPETTVRRRPEGLLQTPYLSSGRACRLEGLCRACRFRYRRRSAARTRGSRRPPGEVKRPAGSPIPGGLLRNESTHEARGGILPRGAAAVNEKARRGQHEGPGGPHLRVPGRTAASCPGTALRVNAKAPGVALCPGLWRLKGDRIEVIPVATSIGRAGPAPSTKKPPACVRAGGWHHGGRREGATPAYFS